MKKQTLILDTEIYRDYYLASFLSVETGRCRHFEMFDGQPLDDMTIRAILRQYRIITFNGNNFDIPLLTVALGGADCAKIKSLSDRIIKTNVKPWTIGLESIRCDHIDLIEVAPGIASLKIYGGRLHCQKLQDLPIEPDSSIGPELRPLLREYCENDLRTTLALFRKLEAQIQLRERMTAEYGVDLRSKSDAQIAEAVIKHEVEKITRRKLEKKDPFRLAGQTFNYQLPDFIQSHGEPLRHAINVVGSAAFTIASNGTVQMPKEVANLKIQIDGSTYRMGIGGLHSSEKSTAHFADDQNALIDRDVASYYPAIILNCGLRPAHMGENFTSVYRTIVNRRLAAKRAKDTVTADSLKITINGSFGKFGSPYSTLYSPTLLIQTTVTGQLSLLMLIEMLESEGIAVVSANTDGIVIKCPREKLNLCEFVVWEWEHATGFETEATEYQAIYSRDVNNYIAIKKDGVKVKGVYAPAALQKNPTNEIVTMAVIKFLQQRVAIEETIGACKDITKFVTVRTVKGGAIDQGGNYLGKAIRWYHAVGIAGPITYKVNGYTVPRSEGARALMQLPEEFPDDVDFKWYVDEAHSILRDIGAIK